MRGETLPQHVAPLAGEAAVLGVFERIAEAVAFAHAAGVVHRDLKPSNVMVGAFGEVLVLDWGVAKVLAAPATTPESFSDRETTPDVVRRTPESSAERLGHADRDAGVHGAGTGSAATRRRRDPRRMSTRSARCSTGC